MSAVVGEALRVAAARKWERRAPRPKLESGKPADRRRLRDGEDPVLTGEERAWVGELATRFGPTVERMVVRRLGGQGVAWEDVERWRDDLVQQAWLLVARGRGGALYARGESDDALRVRLSWMVRTAISEHWRARHLRNEHSTDWVDTVGRTMEPVAPPMLVDGPAELTARCEQLLADLTPHLRAVMVELVCMGRTVDVAAEVLDMRPEVAHRMAQQALRRLRGAAGAPVEAAPEGVDLDELSDAQREALESLPDRARAVLLLRMAGVSMETIADRMQGSLRTVYKVVKEYLPLVEAGRPLDPEQRAYRSLREARAALRAGRPLTDGEQALIDAADRPAPKPPKPPAAPVEPVAVESLSPERRAVWNLAPAKVRPMLLLRWAGATWRVVGARCGVSHQHAYTLCGRYERALDGSVAA